MVLLLRRRPASEEALAPASRKLLRGYAAERICPTISWTGEPLRGDPSAIQSSPRSSPQGIKEGCPAKACR